ncbi:hypothetical protein G5V59_05725 [Nocardioides sp. W3-2-3]|uniref:hypothetical protein n=1 Tax=Nocardioides convexus TaxID=2712224 RepID=UPI0024189835|nr:hypothetical protein [Nocardioides convexus]NGZ99923.1 hypothetical protein [Nocardioides convexus]
MQGKRLEARLTAYDWASGENEYFNRVSVTVPSTLTGATPTISGTTAVGSTLTAAPGTWTTGTTFGYQWLRAGVAISGATAATYQARGGGPGQGDLGQGDRDQGRLHRAVQDLRGDRGRAGRLHRTGADDQRYQGRGLHPHRRAGDLVAGRDDDHLPVVPLGCCDLRRHRDDVQSSPRRTPARRSP